MGAEDCQKWRGPVPFPAHGTNRARRQRVAEAPLGPARGSQPGAQAGRLAHEGQGNGNLKWRVRVSLADMAPGGEPWSAVGRLNASPWAPVTVRGLWEKMGINGNFSGVSGPDLVQSQRNGENWRFSSSAQSAISRRFKHRARSKTFNLPCVASVGSDWLVAPNRAPFFIRATHASCELRGRPHRPWRTGRPTSLSSWMKRPSRGMGGAAWSDFAG